jgi:hypothetical protein
MDCHGSLKLAVRMHPQAAGVIESSVLSENPMRMLKYVGAVLALLLGGCASLFLPPGLNPSQPLVSIIDGEVFVAPDPLVFGPEQKKVEVVWQLPKNAGITFAANGIAIEAVGPQRQAEPGAAGKDGGPDGGISQAGGEFTGCKVRNGGLEYACINQHTRPGRFKYTINLEQGGKAFAKDPTIFNM